LSDRGFSFLRSACKGALDPSRFLGVPPRRFAPFCVQFRCGDYGSYASTYCNSPRQSLTLRGGIDQDHFNHPGTGCQCDRCRTRLVFFCKPIADYHDTDLRVTG
jgi:hypothetical protein